MGGGQPIPAGLSCPPLGFFEQWLAMDSELLFIAFTTINGYVSQNTDSLLRKPISWNSSIYWWGATYPSWFILPPTHDGWGATYPELVYLAPHLDFWAVNGYGFWIAVNYFSTINGYVSQNKDTACWYTKTHFLKFTHIQVGGNISQLVYLTPHPSFGAGTVYT